MVTTPKTTTKKLFTVDPAAMRALREMAGPCAFTWLLGTDEAVTIFDGLDHEGGVPNWTQLHNSETF